MFNTPTVHYSGATGGSGYTAPPAYKIEHTITNTFSSLMRPKGAISSQFLFFPLARFCEQSELDVFRDSYPEAGLFKAVRGRHLA